MEGATYTMRATGVAAHARLGGFGRVATLLAAVQLAACSAGYPGRPAAQSMTLQTAPVLVPQGYVLQAGDLLTIKFYHNPELNEDVVVRPDGMISLQLVGDIKAAGVSPADLSQTLKEKYTGELALPAISVIVRTMSTQRVYVGGEVVKPGVLTLDNGLTLFQAIQVAGGFTPIAHRKQVVLIRKASDGRPVGYAVDSRLISSGEHPEQDIALVPFDVVYVPRSKVGDMNKFVELYIRNNLPVSPGFAVTP
jgi:protein involved in polysaccharide export with SLBB domain